MTLHHGDCLDVMAAMEPESVDAIVTDPPYGLEFMGKEWDRPWAVGAAQGVGYAGRDDLRLPAHRDSRNANCRACGGRMRGARKCSCPEPQWDRHPRQDMVEYGDWSRRWAEAALRVAKPSAYLLAFGGTRTVHRMTVALEDAGWIIRDMLVWAYASGFPKSKASLKPAWEPIVMARKPGPLRDLAIDACRIGTDTERGDRYNGKAPGGTKRPMMANPYTEPWDVKAGRWPANVVLTDPIFDGGWDGVVGGGESASGKMMPTEVRSGERTVFGADAAAGYTTIETYGDSGTYSRFFLIPKADRADREPVLGGLSGLSVDEREHAFDTFNENVGNTVASRRRNHHPTVKPTELMRHLVRLVTPTDGVVLDPFLGSGTTALAAEMEGFAWVGIEREAEYVAIAEARLNGTQRGLGLAS